ncbi:hypothetical protein DFH07DRAFT_150669 [Mycena maculata]|uniref:Uncharacterized protein n=1 Tax=Mycena maculata TaxID=230809 RepID=A0AAD7MV05_9AGAR|nr:hypothetical protein DFH07DRAFT_150669 [Mycena maculata]
MTGIRGSSPSNKRNSFATGPVIQHHAYHRAHPSLQVPRIRSHSHSASIPETLLVLHSTSPHRRSRHLRATRCTLRRRRLGSSSDERSGPSASMTPSPFFSAFFVLRRIWRTPEELRLSASGDSSTGGNGTILWAPAEQKRKQLIAREPVHPLRYTPGLPSIHSRPCLYAAPSSAFRAIESERTPYVSCSGADWRVGGYNGAGRAAHFGGICPVFFGFALISLRLGLAAGRGGFHFRGSENGARSRAACLEGRVGASEGSKGSVRKGAGGAHLRGEPAEM